MFSSGQSIPYDTVYNVNFTIEALSLIYGIGYGIGASKDDDNLL